MKNTEYLMKCTSVRFDFDFDPSLSYANHYSNCYIAIKDNIVILIEDEYELNELIRDIQQEQASNDLNDFGEINSYEQIHFDTLIGRNIGSLFIGYRAVITF